jgi:NADP-reducing hydrogenase subunit HndB
MKSLEELRMLRDQLRESMRVRKASDEIRVVVGMGTCGIAAGARDVMVALLDELNKKGLTNVIVSQTGCIGMCDKEPLVDVQLPGQPTVTYGHMTPDKMRQVVTSHIVNGQPIGEYAIATKNSEIV